MSLSHPRRAATAALTVGLVLPLAASTGADAGSVRTKGTGRSFNIGWTEYDPADVLGLPGNVHVGFLWFEDGPWGTYGFGHVADFDCDEGEVPWGGHGGHGVESVVDEGVAVVEAATETAIDEVIDSGVGAIVPEVVVATVGDEVGDELPDEIIDEVPACDHVQVRVLDASDGGLNVKVDMRNATAKLTGRVQVFGGHGPEGEPGDLLGRPPVDITIKGGDWVKYESSYKTRSATWSYSDWQKGKSHHGGAVTGAIGAMGFADDADDEAFAGFSEYSYRTVERVR